MAERYKGWPLADVERRARAICCPNGCAAEPINGFKPCAWKDWLPEARATLEADDAAGLCLVKKEATEAMVMAAQHFHLAGPAFEADTRHGINAALAKGAIRKE